MIPITKPYFDDEEIIMLKQCLESGWVTQGPMTKAFEKEFCIFQGAKFSVAVSSCTAALHVAMMALDIKPGDEVIVPAFTWVTSASCVEYVGATVRFVDVEMDTMNMDPDKVEAAINSNTRAIVVVHLFGNPAKMDEIMEIARAHDLYVVEDCACAIGTEYKGNMVGTIGDIGCFSFHPRKAITTGEGGMCSTNDEALYQRMLQYRNHGASTIRKGSNYGKPYDMGIYDSLGYNLRLSDIQASVGIAQFKKLSWLLEDRSRCANYYTEHLKKNNNFILPRVEEKSRHTYQSYVVLLNSRSVAERNIIMDRMYDKGIQTRPGTIAISRTVFNKAKYHLNDGDFPIAERCEDLSITLPIYPNMKNEEMDEVIRILSNE